MRFIKFYNPFQTGADIDVFEITEFQAEDALNVSFAKKTKESFEDYVKKGFKKLDPKYKRKFDP